MIEKKKNQTANNVVYIEKLTGVFGNVTNSKVIVNDYSSIEQLLKDHDIPKRDRRELKGIMDDLKTAPAEKKPSLRERAEKWIVKHREVLGAAAEAIGKAIGAAVGQK